MSRGISMGPCFLFVLAGVVLVLSLLVWSRRRRPGVAQPSCGRCGYAVRGLPTFTCPECGADLREVGIVTPTGRQALSPWWRVAIWSVLLSIPALVFTAMMAAGLPSIRTYRDTLSLTRPGSRAYDGVQVEASGRIYRGRLIDSTEMALELTSTSGSKTRLEIDPITLGFRYANDKGSQVQQSSGLDVEAILDWMETAGIDRGNKQVRAEAQRLFGMVQAVARGSRLHSASTSGFQGVSRTSASSHQAPAWFFPSAIGFWVLVWLLGVWYLLKRRPQCEPVA